jgi:DNA-3-methyladenine glycosylase
MKLDLNFYTQDALKVAPLLIGKILVRKLKKGKFLRCRITETEIYRGEEDTACHARVGKTSRTHVLYKRGGYTYVYLCYGIHYLFNIVTGKENHPQAVLIRAIEGYNGPGKLTKFMKIDKSINDLDLITSEEIWIEDDGLKYQYIKDKRIGIEYATEPYKSIKWRFIMKK